MKCWSQTGPWNGVSSSLLLTGKPQAAYHTWPTGPGCRTETRGQSPSLVWAFLPAGTQVGSPPVFVVGPFLAGSQDSQKRVHFIFQSRDAPPRGGLRAVWQWPWILASEFWLHSYSLPWDLGTWPCASQPSLSANRDNCLPLGCRGQGRWSHRLPLSPPLEPLEESPLKVLIITSLKNWSSIFWQNFYVRLFLP